MAKKPSAWEKRNAAARAKGYRNYYDYRIHEYGKRPPDEPVQSGERRKLSGKRGAASLRRVLRKPDRIALIVEAPTRRDKEGHYTHVNYIITYTDGDIREYELAVDDDWDAWLDYWHDLFDDADVDFLEYATTPGAATAAA